MSDQDAPDATVAVPALHPGAEAAAAVRAARRRQTSVVRDGQSWRIGTGADVAWIAAGTAFGTSITSAIPAVFDAYATILIPADRDGHGRRDKALLAVLRERTADQPWWLGYLDTGADDVVFPDAATVTLYGWSYVLVEAEPEHAATWRRWDKGAFWWGHLPNLMFPADHSWLVSALWDDDWTCVGGPIAVIGSLTNHPDLDALTRQVQLGEEATPPGHPAI